MQRLPSTGRSSRPKALQTKSFTRFEPQKSPATPRSRSNTLPESPVLPPPANDNAVLSGVPILHENSDNNDIYEQQDHDERVIDKEDFGIGHQFDGSVELPTEIQALVETFLETLGAKVHPTPLSIDKLSQLFQDFYEHAYEHIDVYIDLLASRFPSGKSASPSLSSSGSTQTAGGSKKTTKSSTKSGGGTQALSIDQQMLTPAEIAGRRKARRQLEQKRVALGDAVERSICEKVYPRIWRHRSTHDEARDEKLRSRAAALALVGVGLGELLSTAMDGDVDSASQLQLGEDDSDSTRARLSGARHSIQQMNEDRYPLGKLLHLKAAHKSIVESLQQMYPSTSSADEVLPTLIYTIITSDPDTNHVVSNFNFIQRFRASSKIDGEAAYCLTNLEAAITFLETIDLSSLRSDEPPEGPPKPLSQPSTPRTDTPDPMYHGIPSDTSKPFASPPSKDHPAAPSPNRSRGLSLLTQPRQRSSPLDTTSDAQHAVLKKADEAFDTIHSALDGSFKFLFGRLRERERQQTSAASPHRGPATPLTRPPKTLEDARKLIGSPSPSPAPAEDDVSVDGSLGAEQPDDTTAHSPSVEKAEDASSRVLQLIGGRRQREREHSVDSGKSGDSGSRKVSFADGTGTAITTNTSSPGAPPNGPQEPAPPAPTPPSPSSKYTQPVAATPTTLLANQTPAAAPTPHALPQAHALPSAVAYGAGAGAAAVESMRNLGTTLTLNPLRGLAGMGMMRGFGRSNAGTGAGMNTPSAGSPLEGVSVREKERERDKDGSASAPAFRFSLAGVAPPVQRFVACRDARELSGFENELLLRDYQRLAGVLRALRASEEAGEEEG